LIAVLGKDILFRILISPFSEHGNCSAKGHYGRNGANETKTLRLAVGPVITVDALFHFGHDIIKEMRYIADGLT